jgi:tRNA threonylcarbamoyladenosine biosynthesis protein TsaB
VKTLAVDTTSERESVALVEGGAVRGEVRLRSVDVHSRRLMPAIAFLLEAAGLAAMDLDGFAVTVGPGSFTAVRVGLSTVQGLALAAGRPCLGMSTLDVLAAKVAGEAPTLAAVVDGAREGQLFTALYDGGGGRREEPRVESLNALLDRVAGPAAFIGGGADRCRAEILARRADAVFPRRSLYLAAALGMLAEPRLAGGEGTAPSELRALYLRAADVWKHAP